MSGASVHLQAAAVILTHVLNLAFRRGVQRAQLGQELRGGGAPVSVGLQAAVNDALQSRRRLTRQQPPQVPPPRRRLTWAPRAGKVQWLEVMSCTSLKARDANAAPAGRRSRTATASQQGADSGSLNALCVCTYITCWVLFILRI